MRIAVIVRPAGAAADAAIWTGEPDTASGVGEQIETVAEVGTGHPAWTVKTARVDLMNWPVCADPNQSHRVRAPPLTGSRISMRSSKT